MQGIGPVTSGLSAGMMVTNPGEALLPATWRVVNIGVPGGIVPGMVTRRDAATGSPLAFLPGGQNVVAFEIGRNDLNPRHEEIAVHRRVDHCDPARHRRHDTLAGADGGADLTASLRVCGRAG